MDERECSRLIARVERLESRLEHLEVKYNRLLEFVIRINEHFGNVAGVMNEESEIGSPIEPDWPDYDDED